jgi:hypothetical protein
MQSSFFAVRLTGSIFRTSADRERARKDLVEGPLMGLQCRPETRFRGSEQPVGTGQGEALDLLREIGALLLLAQERARHGKSPTRPGEGKWYTCIPRWGGGPGGEVANPAGNSDEMVAPPPDDGKKKAASTKNRGRRYSAAEAYKRLQPGLGTWDPRVTYLAVGKEENSDFDNVTALLLRAGASRILLYEARCATVPCSDSILGLSSVVHQPPCLSSAAQSAQLVHLFH